MIDFFAQYGLFALKTITLVLAILFLFGGIVAITRKSKSDLMVTFLNKEYQNMKQNLEKEIFGKKTKQKKAKKSLKSSLYVVDFNGDMKATQVEALRKEISAILSVIGNKDEVLIRLESPGGTVNGYGLAASQLQRLRDRDIPITACIDKIAASGGYLMACVADQIIAAPFAVIGSIGVITQMPNFHRWLQKNDIDVELLTAGEYKRTLTIFGKNTPKGRAKFQEDLNLIHDNFRQYVLSNRKGLNIDKVATGEHWLAADAIELKLIDLLQTSDEFIMEKLNTHNVYQIKCSYKQNILEKILRPAAKLLHPFG